MIVLGTTTKAIPLTIDSRIGSQTAFVCVTSHGRAARSARMSTGWTDSRRASRMPIRPDGLEYFCPLLGDAGRAAGALAATSVTPSSAASAPAISAR